jgi:hypothetical protein
MRGKRVETKIKSINELWDNFKKFNMLVFRVPERNENREKKYL